MLRFIAILNKIAGVVLSVLCAIGLVGVFIMPVPDSERGGIVIALVVGMLLWPLYGWGVAEFILLLIDIEDNTRARRRKTLTEQRAYYDSSWGLMLGTVTCPLFLLATVLETASGHHLKWRVGRVRRWRWWWMWPPVQLAGPGKRCFLSPGRRSHRVPQAESSKAESSRWAYGQQRSHGVKCNLN